MICRFPFKAKRQFDYRTISLNYNLPKLQTSDLKKAQFYGLYTFFISPSRWIRLLRTHSVRELTYFLKRFFSLIVFQLSNVISFRKERENINF